MNKIFNNKIFKFFIRIIEFILIVGFIIYLTFFVLCKMTENGYINNYKFMVIDNNSLKGKYNKYDAVIVERKDFNKYKEGDLVAYKETKTRDNYQKIERIYNKEGSNDLFALTRNLNNKIFNPDVNIKDIYGVILDKIPVVTEINYIINTYTILVFCVTIFIIMMELFISLGENKELKNTEIKIEPVNKEKDKKTTK